MIMRVRGEVRHFQPPAFFFTRSLWSLAKQAGDAPRGKLNRGGPVVCNTQAPHGYGGVPRYAANAGISARPCGCGRGGGDETLCHLNVNFAWTSCEAW